PSTLLPSTHPSPTYTSTLSLHDALPISLHAAPPRRCASARWPSRAPPAGRCARAPRTPDGGPPPRRRADPPRALSRARCSRRNRSEEHTSELQSPYDLVCRLLLEKKNTR